VKLIYDGHNRYDFHAVDLWTRPTVPWRKNRSMKFLLKDKLGGVNSNIFIFIPILGNDPI